MIRFIFLFVLLMHGLIHLLGFVKEFNLSEVGQLTGKTLFPLTGTSSKIVGVLWLLCCILFIISALLFLIKKEWWWMIGLTAVLISQILILLYWSDAKFGTIVNLILFVGILLSYASWDFKKMVSSEKEKFLTEAVHEPKVITEELISPLPAVVQKWLKRSNLLGKDLVQTVYLTQKGIMRTAPEGKWMKFKAEQNFTVNNPGFIWTTKVDGGPFMKLVGRDKYEDGRGHMLIKLFSLIPVADARGKETDQGTLLRYMGEMVWFPSVALSSYIKWEQIDEKSAKATMNYGGVTASGVYRFNSEGDFLSFEAKRYFDRKEGATLEDWFVRVADNGYKTFQGIKIPAKCEVIWKLKTGDFNWLKLEIMDVKYNSGDI